MNENLDAAVEAANTLSPEALIQAAFESGELFVAEHFVFISVP